MSSRQLRKLQQQREIEQAKLRGQEDGLKEGKVELPESEEKSYRLSSNKPGLFASFAALQDEDEAAEEGDSTEKEKENEHDSRLGNTSALLIDVPKKTKRSKKKKKKSKGADQNTPASDNTSPRHIDGPDEIDTALQELSIGSGRISGTPDVPGVSFDPEYERVCALLGINTNHLKVANEMRNLFGRTAVDSHDDAGGPVPRAARRRQRVAQQQVDLETALRGHHAPGKGLPELTLRRNVFVQGKDDWPRGTTGGLKMEIVDDLQAEDGTVEFRFVHDQAYDLVQQQFNVFVEMGDPQNLIGLLQRNPYHISLLLQVSKVAKDQTDHALSSDLVERALFTFGRASQSLFAIKLSQGKARLDFARPENRELWLAGYQYIKSLIMKGTYRTALEWAKLLLSLDPEQDPYCMMLMIHHLALRAFQSQYLLDLGNTPTWRIWSICISHASPSLALAAMQLKDGKKCRSLLLDSIEQLPWLFCKLFQELNLDNPPPSIWGVVPTTDAENLFSEIYIRQTKDLWNTPEATSLLMEVAHAAKKPDAQNLPKVDISEVTLDVARFVYLDNTPALMALVPSKLLHRIPNSDSDPLPPDQNIFSWDSQRTAFARDQNRQGPGGAFGNHFNQMAAIRAILDRNVAHGEDHDITDAEIRDILEGNANTEDTDGPGPSPESENETEIQPRSSAFRRLYDLVFGVRNTVEHTETMQDDSTDSDGIGDATHDRR